jgi:iron complex outermembrane receptor protein
MARWLLVASLALCSIAQAQRAPRAAEVSLDSLLNTRISAPSKYAQSIAESPASVTIVTSEEISRYGYHNLQEVLENVRGFYVSNDRNYTYLGARGFSRPTDYNNRILLLIDGHTMNDQVWGSAIVGSDLPINLDAVERIEIVRGPGSALYGTSAMFAVINIVTRTGPQLDGVIASGRVGSGRKREAALAAGHTIGVRGSFAFSGLYTHTDGNDLYFREYDAPETNFGIAHGLDWERAYSALGSFNWGDVTARVGYTSREKGIPTGSFEIAFNDPRYQSKDATLWGDVSLQRQLGASIRLMARAYADRYRYDGINPIDAGPAPTDGGSNNNVGGEAMVIWDPLSRDRVTIGTEFRRVSRAEYHERDENGVLATDNAPFDVASLFAQNELQLVPRLKLVTGLRYDRKSSLLHALTPRVALIGTPDDKTTVKLLYGEAFRAPSAAEADITTVLYTRNPSLKAERVKTFELESERRIAPSLLAGLSLYEYHLDNLIDPVVNEGSGTQQYFNVAKADGYGAELQLDLASEGRWSGRVTYAVQRTRGQPSAGRLTNSPAQVATVSVAMREWHGLRPAMTLRYETERLTVQGTSTPAFARADLNVAYFGLDALGSWLRETRLSVRVANVFDQTYYAPGGVEHRMASIAQDGRTLLLRLDRTF